MLDIPPRSRLRRTFCPKFALDMAPNLFRTAPELYAVSRSYGLTTFVAFEPNFLRPEPNGLLEDGLERGRYVRFAPKAVIRTHPAWSIAVAYGRRVIEAPNRKVYRQRAVNLLDMHAVRYRRQGGGRSDYVIRRFVEHFGAR